MPIYEYVCSGCDLKFELMRTFSQSGEAADCPGCQKTAERILSVFACFSTDSSGMSAPLGGSSCASCNAGSCATCAM